MARGHIRLRRGGSRRLAALTLVGVGALLGAAALTPGAEAASDGSTTSYYTVEPVCAKAQPGAATCFALKRVRVSKGTRGAHAVRSSPSAVPVGPAGGFTPGDLAKAYAVNPAGATKIVVGIVDAHDDPSALADLNHFDATYGLPPETASSFLKVSQTGSTTALPTPDAGWAGEISLDLDAVRGMCHTCRIVLVETTDESFTNLAAGVNEAVAKGAKVISNSYGGAESGTTEIQPAVLKAYNHPGIVITASTGDDGFYGWDVANDGDPSSNAPATPASYNTVVAVGGTSLQLNDDGTRSGEAVWNDNGPANSLAGSVGQSLGATGGGCSREFTAPPWQHAVAHYSQTACGTHRLAADVSALADPVTGFDVYDTYQSSGWGTYGGTSLSSPLIAAMWALAGGSGGVKYPSLSLYGHFRGSPSTVNDITVGGNGFCDGVNPASCENDFGGPVNTTSAGILDCAWDSQEHLAPGTRACEAATGYDGPTGVGSPHGLTAFKPATPNAHITGPRRVARGQKVVFRGVSSTDPFPGGRLTGFRWTLGKMHVTAKNVNVTFHAKGTFALRLTVKDNYGVSDTTVFRIRVV